MPNWCANILNVSGPPELVEDFDRRFKGRPACWPMSIHEICTLMRRRAASVAKVLLKEGDFEPTYCFNALYPVPDDVVESGYDPAGYCWCATHWGTKWDVAGDVVLHSHHPGFCSYLFKTAWSPPERWLAYVAQTFPNLTFELLWCEPGMQIAGSYLYKDGQLVESWSPSIAEEYNRFVEEEFGWEG
ncbi:MAG: hypothetical protein AB1330_01485 [Bacillota bacterium]